MPTIKVAYIIVIDSADATVDRVAQWLRKKDIVPSLFCTQIHPSRNRLIIICELDSFAAGFTARRLRKLEGVTALECLLPKQYSFRRTPPGLLDSLQPSQ